MNKGKKAQKVSSKQEEFNPKKYEQNGLTEDEVLEIKTESPKQNKIKIKTNVIYKDLN